jgi:hypothetical protein
MPPLHLSQAELAAYWRISPRTLERWRCTGNGPRFLKLGSRVVYRIADVEAFEATRLHRRTQLRANRKVENRAELSGKSKGKPYAHLRSATRKLYSLRDGTRNCETTRSK